MCMFIHAVVFHSILRIDLRKYYEDRMAAASEALLSSSQALKVFAKVLAKVLAKVFANN